MTSIRNLVYQDIDTERARQAELWNREHDFGFGDCSSDDVQDSTKLAVLLEEVGEVARAYLYKDKSKMRTELVQVAAVAVAWLEAL